MTEATKYFLAPVIAFMFGSAVSAFADPLASGVPQSFSYSAPGPYADKPITVHYYKPKSATADAKILFAIHGVERSGGHARDNWMAASEQYGVIVLAPEFDEARFPSKLFQWGGMQEKDPANRPFQIIESLFDKVRGDEGLKAQDYYLFGHSAGGQFVHRYVLMMDHPRIKLAVAANAGTYTFPRYSSSVFGSQFPWALDDDHIDRSALKERFSRSLLILLGESDIKTTGDFPRSAEAMAQGATRLERGKNFFEAAKQQAHELNADLQWRCVTIPGIGHNSAKMSQAAANLMFEGDSLKNYEAGQCGR